MGFEQKMWSRYGSNEGNGGKKDSKKSDSSAEADVDQLESDSRHGGEVLPLSLRARQMAIRAQGYEISSRRRGFSVEDLDAQAAAQAEQHAINQRVYEEEIEDMNKAAQNNRFEKRRSRKTERRKLSFAERQELSLRCDILELFGKLIHWSPAEVESVCVDLETGFLLTNRAMTVMRSIQTMRHYEGNERTVLIQCVSEKGYILFENYEYGPAFFNLHGIYKEIDDKLREYEQCISQL